MIARRRRVGSESESREFSSQNYAQSSQTYSQGGSSNSQIGSYSNSVNNNLDSFSDISDMTCRDRTNEFMSAVKTVQHSRMGNGTVGYQPGKTKYDTRLWSDFMKIAKSIGSDIGSTYTKLEKLTLLARKNSLFDDRPADIEELTYIVKQDIGSLNKQIAQLQTLVKSQQNSNGYHMQTHSNSVVVSLQSKLASMSYDFKKVLEVRTENLKLQKNRRDQFTQGGVSSSLPPSAIAGYHQGSVLIADEQASGSGQYSINMPSDVVPSSYYQQQQMQVQLIDEQDSYLQSRAETMQNIESTIVELGGIFQQLAFMVKEQEEMIQRVDANVEETNMNVEAAHSEIVKYFRSVSSNRWLMIKIFAVLLFFFIVFIVFMA